MSMRTWKKKLFLDAMPGRNTFGRPKGDFDHWLREMEQNEIGTVVCLTPERQIAGESPAYAEWRRQQQERRADRKELIDLPIEDFNAPEPQAAQHFWQTARRVAEQIENGERVFVHCAAGIGRTGMFSIAVLMSQGRRYEEAYQEIAAVGSRPEMPEQKAFLRRGPVSS